MKKIDFHTHILPNVDDGADSIDVSLKMLHRLAEQQVDTVVLSPHYYANREPIERFIERRDRAVEALKNAPIPKTIHLRVGAEVHFAEYLFNNRDLSQLCIDGTDTMLVELPFNRPIDSRLLSQIERLRLEYGVTPLLAHIERYPEVLRSQKHIDFLMEIGCVCQVNVSSFTAFGRRKLISYIKNGFIGALGTDAHNMSSRPPEFEKGYQYVCNRLSEDEIFELEQTMQWLLLLKK